MCEKLNTFRENYKHLFDEIRDERCKSVKCIFDFSSDVQSDNMENNFIQKIFCCIGHVCTVRSEASQ